MFEIVDKLHEETKAQESYNEIQKIYENCVSNQENVEVLWRYARACHSLASTVQNNSQKKELLQEGQSYAEKAYKLDKTNFDVTKFIAILTGALTDFLSTKERIQQGFLFKGYLDEGLKMKPREKTLLHMRGRFSYSVASLTWLERKAASAFFATPPTASFDEAIADFLEVESIVNGTWIENLLFLAKSYLGKNDSKNAVVYLEKVLKLVPNDESEKAALAEARTLLNKYSK